jgi:hypothetical protein
MKVKCIDNKGIARNRLTIDKEYIVIKISPHLQYKVREDNGEETWWNRERFIK